MLAGSLALAGRGLQKVDWLSPAAPYGTAKAPRSARGARCSAQGGVQGAAVDGRALTRGPAAPSSAFASHIVPSTLAKRQPRGSDWQQQGAPPAPRVLQVQSAAELQHLLACHPQRLIVAHFSTDGCSLDQAYQPAYAAACQRHPRALFLRVAVRRGDPSGEKLLQGLGLGRLPATLLLRSAHLLARVDMGPDCSASGGSAAPPDNAAAAAAQAAQQLEDALRQHAEPELAAASQ